jgi:hypothetical protein
VVPSPAKSGVIGGILPKAKKMKSPIKTWWLKTRDNIDVCGDGKRADTALSTCPIRITVNVGIMKSLATVILLRIDNNEVQKCDSFTKTKGLAYLRISRLAEFVRPYSAASASA